MVAANAGAAREGAMKDYADYCRCFWWMLYYIVCVLFYDGKNDYRTRITGSTGSTGFLKVERWFTQIGADIWMWNGEKKATKQASSNYIPCHPGQRPGIQSFRNKHPAPKQRHQSYISCHPGQAHAWPGIQSFEMAVVKWNCEMVSLAMKYNTAQNDLSVNPCNPFHPYDAWHANLIRIDGFDGFTDYYGKRIRLFTQPRNKSTRLHTVSSREVGAPSGVAYPGSSLLGTKHTKTTKRARRKLLLDSRFMCKYKYFKWSVI
jgi:hypothetical protein